MKTRTLFWTSSFAVFLILFGGIRPAAADYSHARIVRLSLVQGDVRFTRSAAKDPLADQNAAWESAVVNLPIRQGYVLSTGSGRAAVEFESGASAYLDENSVLEFYDLSLDEGARVTRLVLRQGTATFYVHPGREDVFTVTGGDFTAQADGRASFRMDNYDDGSTIGVGKGHVSVLTKSQTNQLEKGQSLTMRAGEDASVSLGRLPAESEFDKWVSGREESVATATNSSLQYVSSPYYSSGFSDLYTYGSWIPYAGYGNCWRPFGAGLGWSPFGSGQWAFDPIFGWSWVSYEPWGWLPYHFGGWIFSPGYGWLWAPGNFGSGVGYWRPSTAVWVRSAGGHVGIVPVHPRDAHGKPPINLERGVITTRGMGDGMGTRIAADPADRWKALKSPPKQSVRSEVVAAAPPQRVSRTVLAGNSGPRGVSIGRDSGIAFDARERKFINSNAPTAPSENPATRVGDAKSAVANAERGTSPAGHTPTSTGGASPGNVRPGDARNIPPPARASTPPTVRISPPARTYTPPAPPRSASAPREGSSGASSGGTQMSRPAPAPMPRSSPAPMPRSSPAPAPRPAPRPH